MIGRRRMAARALLLSALYLLPSGPAGAQGTAVVRGRITLGAKQPMSGATVVVEDSLRRQTSARTDAAGKFRMLVRAPGSYQLAVMRVGTTPAVGPQFEVIPEDTIDANVQVPVVASDTAVALDSVRVVGEGASRSARLFDFEKRRLDAAATRSITRAEIEKRNPVDAWQMLTNVPSVKIAQQGSLVIARSMRVETVSLLKANTVCYMRLMIDGMLMPENSRDDAGTPATDLSRMPRPNEIHGIEVFAGPASIPLQYGGTGSGKWCGMIAIWTR